MEHNQKAFQEKIRSLMEKMTLSEFAGYCGISRTNLTKLLSDRNTAPPRKSTLKKIADSTGCGYDELLKICGYSVSAADGRQSRNFEERAALNALDMENGFAALTKGVVLYNGIGDFLDTYGMLYSHENCKFTIYGDGEYEGMLHDGAENCMHLFADFTDESGTICRTFAVIFYAKTTGGKIVVTGTAMDGPSLLDTGFMSCDSAEKIGLSYERIRAMQRVYVIHESAEEKLLRSIFGESSQKYPQTLTGFGFSLDDVPERFREFVIRHKDSLPDTEAAEAYLAGEDAEEAFAGYGLKQYGRKNAADAGRYRKWIADVMKAETGFEFRQAESDMELSDEPPCIFVENYLGIGETEDERDENFEKLSEAVAEYAKELGIRKYGERYVSVYMPRNDIMQFETENKEEEE